MPGPERLGNPPIKAPPCDGCEHEASCRVTRLQCSAFSAYLRGEHWKATERHPNLKVTLKSRRKAARVSVIEQREDAALDRRRHKFARIAAWKLQHPEKVAEYRRLNRERKAAAATAALAQPPADVSSS